MGDRDTLDVGASKARPALPAGESKHRRGQGASADKSAGPALVDALPPPTVGILFPEFRARFRFLLELQMVRVAARGLPLLRNPERRKNSDLSRRGPFHSVFALRPMVVQHAGSHARNDGDVVFCALVDPLHPARKLGLANRGRGPGALRRAGPIRFLLLPAFPDSALLPGYRRGWGRSGGSGAPKVSAHPARGPGRRGFTGRSGRLGLVSRGRRLDSPAEWVRLSRADYFRWRLLSLVGRG